MSDHLKKITARAKKIRAKKPTMKWTDAVKEASKELGFTKPKSPGRKSGVVIYARQSKTKTGKTRTKVYARAKPVRKAKPGGSDPMTKFSPGRKPKPKKPSGSKSFTYVTPGGKLIKFNPKSGRTRIMGVSSEEQIQKELRAFSMWVSKLANPPSVYYGLVTFRPKILFGEPVILAEVGYDPIDKFAFKYITDYQLLKKFADGINNENKEINTARMNGLRYRGGKPMLSINGYKTKPERIFIGKTSQVCNKAKMLKPRAKNIGELESVYSVPEIKVELLGRKAVVTSRSIANSDDCARIIRNYIDSKYPGLRSTKEGFGMLCLNFQNQPIGVYLDTIGTQNSTQVDTRYMVGVALKIGAMGVIIFHNHPSGRMIPSSADKKLTQELKEAYRSVQISMLDHVILSGVDDNYYSFADNNEI